MTAPEQTLFNRALIPGYDPLDHIMNGSVGIAELPHLPEFILRWFPNLTDDEAIERYLAQAKSSTDPGTVLTDVLTDDSMPHYFQRFQEELAAVEQCGVNIPHPGREQFSILREAGIVAYEGLAIFTLVKRYEPRPLQPDDPLGLPQIEGLMSYLAGKTIQPSMFLYDLFKSKQHARITDDKGRRVAKLLDIEPLLAHPDDPSTYRSGKKAKVIVSCLHNLLEWSEQIANAS